MPRRRRRAKVTHNSSPAPTEGLTDKNTGKPAMPGPVYDSTYTNDISLGQYRYDTTNAGLDLAEGRIGFDTGFGPNGQADLSSPYNQAMMLQRAHDQASTGITNSYAASGQLYSGARQSTANEENFQYERSLSNLKTAASRGYEDIGLARRSAGDDRTEAFFNAGANQAGRWAGQQRDWYSTYA